MFKFSMNLSKKKYYLIIGLVLFRLNMFSYSRLSKNYLKETRRVLYYTLKKEFDQQKLYQNLFWEIVKHQKLPLVGGKLIIDNTTIDKSYSKKLEGASYVWDSRKGRSVYGYSIVTLIWVVNGYHIVLGSLRYIPGNIIPGKYTKKGHPKRTRAPMTHSEMACALLSFARNQLGIQPESVHFDEFFTCEKLLKLMKGYNWPCYFAMRSNRKFEGEKLNTRKWKSTPEWGKLRCGIKVSLMKDGNNYYGSTRFGVSRWDVKKNWCERWDIEEDFRFLKSQLFWECCQSVSVRVQENHWFFGTLSFLLIQLLAKELGVNWYQAKDNAYLHKKKLNKLAVKYFKRIL